MKNYNDLDSIDRDLQILNLERQIAWEEMKSVIEQYKEDIQPVKWVKSGLKIVGSIAGLFLVKKLVD